MIETREILCSENPQNSRLMTMFWRYPKYLHQESLRHRTLYIHDCLYDPDFSFSVSSARAIPFRILLEEVRNDNLRAAPEVWGCEQKGMSQGDELTGEALNTAKFWWKQSALDAAFNAERMTRAEGLKDAMPWDIPHKSIVNRIIEPYIHVNCLVTGTECGWLNFFGLRLDKAADTTLQKLAENAWKVWNESKPQKLLPGQWHLPYVQTEEDKFDIWNYTDPNHINFDEVVLNRMKQISAARCARLSYLSFETKKRSTIEEDLKLYERLLNIGGPIHASPFEHQATPDEQVKWLDASIQDHVNGTDWFWKNPKLSGNLGPGWIQARKLLPNEAVAKLPGNYQ